MKFDLTLVSALALAGVVACSPKPEGGSAEPSTKATQAAAVQASASASDGLSPEPSGSETRAQPGPAKVIGLKGLGDLRIGEPVPSGTSWAERGAQTGEACRTVSSPEYPGVYAIVTDGKVRRITVGQRSDVKLVEGIGVGASEQDVKKWFGGFRTEPHKYEDAPAKYLTAPNAASGDVALRFEIGRDGKVSMIHVGTMPVLGYVEGCA